MATCAACGNEVAEGASFCDHCGQTVDPEGFTTYAMKDPSTGPLFEVASATISKPAGTRSYNIRRDLSGSS